MNIVSISQGRACLDSKKLGKYQVQGSIRQYQGRTHVFNLSQSLSDKRKRQTEGPLYAQTQEDVYKGVQVGEDAANFKPENETTESWIKFVAVFAAVMLGLYVLWINPSTGFSDDYLNFLDKISPNASVNMVEQLVVFALIHSGLAYARPWGEDLIGKRGFRVLFGSLSLPLAVTAIVFMINHRYEDGLLWNARGIPGIHSFIWIANLVSFWLLYPSTFNIKEVAAVDKPELHMYETGIIRITRHPQMVGQLIWCFAHTIWIGSTFMLTTSAALMAHHLFSVYHGDFRQRRKYGEAFDVVKSRTSTFPFQAIWEGRQKLPENYINEFIRVPYITITVLAIGAYFGHPLMQKASHSLHW